MIKKKRKLQVYVIVVVKSCDNMVVEAYLGHLKISIFFAKNVHHNKKFEGVVNIPLMKSRILRIKMKIF